MASILVEIRQKYTPEQESALLNGVYLALQEAFITPGRINARLIVHEPHRFACPTDLAKPELYTHISIDCLAGRSIDAKRKLYQRIVENLAMLNIPKDHVKILLRENPKENWGIRGGQAGCDVDLSDKVNV